MSGIEQCEECAADLIVVRISLIVVMISLNVFTGNKFYSINMTKIGRVGRLELIYEYLSELFNMGVKLGRSH